jgi:predicted transcriptional regulator
VPDLNDKQVQTLQNPTRMAIYSYIQEQRRLGRNARTPRAITDRVEGLSEASCFYHLTQLERVGLVEREQGESNGWRVRR